MGFLRVSAVACVIALACAAPATAQDIFTTKNYRQDRALWTNPAYYRNNTVRALVDMAEMTDTLGKQGTGADGKITTPYPYKTSQEHYDAWLKAANGGTKHTLATLPDWDGRWRANQGKRCRWLLVYRAQRCNHRCSSRRARLVSKKQKPRPVGRGFLFG